MYIYSRRTTIYSWVLKQLRILEDKRSDDDNAAAPSNIVDDSSRDEEVDDGFGYEEDFIENYAHFLDGVPRKIKRILNVYGVSREIAMRSNARKLVSLKKLFLFVVLQELCPYRTSWLLYISQCAENSVDSNTAMDDESLPFCTLLEDLRGEDDDITDIRKLNLAKVYTRIVCGVLHCLPFAKKHLRADSGLMYYGELLGDLTLQDLYSDRLQMYVFNLPRSMMDDIKMYRNDCVIGKRTITIDDGQGRSFWVAEFWRVATLSKSQGRAEEGETQAAAEEDTKGRFNQSSISVLPPTSETKL